jgi:hypothetical protein
MPASKNSQYASLLNDPDTRRWYDGLERNSLATADAYLDNFGRFLARNQLTAPSFLALAPKQRDDLMMDHITTLHRAKLSRSTMKGSKAAVASWLDHHGERFTRRFRFPRALVPTKTSQFRIPDQSGTRRIHDAANTRQRLAATLTGQAGLRPAILGNKKGTAGLQFKHLPEARLTPAGIEFERIPTRIKVPDYLNKVRHAFFTFLGPEGCDYLAANVQERLQRGELLTPESPVLPPLEIGRERVFLASSAISDLVRVPLRKAGMKEPPYILRSFFGNRCLMAQNTMGLLHDYKEFFMGHAGSISATYALNKGELPNDTIEAMRTAYTDTLELLETRQTGPRKDPWIDLARVALAVAGTTEEDIAKLDLAGMAPEDMVALLKKQVPAGKIAQRIVTAGELDPLILSGWRFIGPVGDGRFILEAA